MSEPKNTPGPWGKVRLDGYCEGGSVWAFFDKDRDCIFDVCCCEGGIKDADLELMLAAPDMYEALEAYEKVEADILLNANWNTPSGVPQITQEQFDMLIDCQTIRYNALRKARGETE